MSAARRSKAAPSCGCSGGIHGQAKPMQRGSKDTKEYEISAKWLLVPRCFFDGARFSLFRYKPPKRAFGCAEMKNCTRVSVVPTFGVMDQTVILS
jgi:hypothetical protein